MAGDSLTELLGRALSAFEQREEGEALRHLLVVWRESRAERVAVLVDAVSARLSEGAAPLDPGPYAPAMQAQQPTDLPRLLAGLEASSNRGFADLLGRQLEAFRQWPADPRFTPSLLALLRLPISREPRVLGPLCDLLVYLRDSRAVEELRALRADLESGSLLAQRLDVIVEMTTLQEVPSLGPEARALCDAVEEAVSARNATEARSAPIREALLARVYAHPEDDSARLVLADHLLEVGDPLGEFIMLQVTSPSSTARMSELLGKYRAKWLGPLGPIIDPGSARFERGFPVALTMDVERRQPLPPPGPAWSTVRDIDWFWRGPPEAAAWLADPHLRSVTRLRRTRAAIARRLGAHGLGIRRLEMQGGLRVQAPEAFMALAGLPHLTWLEIPEAEADDVSLCAASPLARRLEHFEVASRREWSLVVTPSQEVTVEVTIVGELRWHGMAMVRDALVRAIRAAAAFGTRGLRLRIVCPLVDEDRLLLEAAGAAYAHVEWV